MEKSTLDSHVSWISGGHPATFQHGIISRRRFIPGMLIPSSWIRLRRQVIHWISFWEYNLLAPLYLGLDNPSASYILSVLGCTPIIRAATPIGYIGVCGSGKLFCLFALIFAIFIYPSPNNLSDLSNLIIYQKTYNN